MDCKSCDIPDLDCHEQCKEGIDKCYGCFGASFGDCQECIERREKKENEE